MTVLPSDGAPKADLVAGGAPNDAPDAAGVESAEAESPAGSPATAAESKAADSIS
ncbi:MAG: hypothetical protein ACM3ZE_29990 [Myxococcales bacterium]